MIRMLLIIPSRVYTRFASSRETKNVTAVVMLVNKPLKAARLASSPIKRLEMITLNGKSTVKKSIEYKIDESAIMRNNGDMRTKSNPTRISLIKLYLTFATTSRLKYAFAIARVKKNPTPNRLAYKMMR